MMRRLLALLVLIGAPAFAREVRGRVSQAEEGSEEARKLAGGAYVVRLTVEVDGAQAVTLNAQEGITQVFESSQPARLAQVRANARIKATVDDDCKLESGFCVAAQIDVEQPAGLTRIEAVKEHAAIAEEAPDMKALGGSRGDARDAADDLGEPVKRRFIKGELTNLGSDKLVLADSRFGLRSGVARLDNSIYLAVAPELDLHFGDWLAIGLGLPLNVRAYADGFYDTHKIKFREGDYAQASDYARILRFLTIGRKEDQLYLTVSPLFAASIGHGAIVRRYNANIESPQEPFGYDKKVGAEIDAYGRYGGFEAFTGDMMHPNHFLAGLAFLKPLGWLTGPARETWGWTSIGISTAVDFAAPYTLDRGPNGYPQVGDADVCPQTGVDYCEPDDPIAKETRRAQVVGVDLETKVVKTENADVKPYLDYSRLLDISNPTGPGARSTGGGGWTLGTLGRFNAGDVKTHAFRLVGELRYFDGNYLPGYFDTFYEVQKYQFITGKADTGYEPKLRTVLDRDPSHKRAGYYVEAAYQYNGGLALMAAYEDSFHVSGPDSICFGCTGLEKYVGSRNLTLHIEYPAYSWLQFFASFYRRSFDGPVDASHPLGDNTLIYGAARLHVLWVFFLNARVFRSWRPDPVLGEMRNLWGGDFDLEIGYEFDRSSRK